MSTFDFNTINAALNDPDRIVSGVDFSGKSLKLDNANDAQPIVDAINACPNLQFLTLTGNTLGVAAAQKIASALEHHPELKVATFSDMFTGRMKTEIPPALSALGDGMITAGARLTVLDLSDNAFGPIGVEGLAKLLQSDVCSQLEELRLNNNGLGITGGTLLAKALSASPRRLKIFVAGRNRLENNGAIALAAVFQRMGTLEELSMPQNGIYHPGVAALAGALRHNARLRSLNLNDNTVGRRGAAALAAAVPHLKNLRSINFGDCLLKSKGALALAVAIQENNLLLETLDVSNNEIGRVECMRLVDALTAQPDSSERLARVVLAGNSLGDAENKKLMLQKLGACAELTDGDASDDDEYVTESEEEVSEAEEESEDSATEDAQHLDTVVDIKDESLDNSGVDEVTTDVGKFLKAPTVENLRRLGSNAGDLIIAHLETINDTQSSIDAHVEAALCACGLRDSRAARRLLHTAADRAARRHAAWTLTDAMLRGLALIKTENKNYRIRWNLPSCFATLAEEMDQSYFPTSLRDTLRFFIKNKMPSMPEETRTEVEKHPTLYK